MGCRLPHACDNCRCADVLSDVAMAAQFVDEKVLKDLSIAGRWFFFGLGEQSTGQEENAD